MLKFLEHFAAIRDAIESQGLWDEADGLFYDRLALPDGTAVPVRVRSMVGIIPMLAAGVVDEPALDRVEVIGKRFAGLPRAAGAARPRGPRQARTAARRDRATGRCCWAWSASTGCERIFDKLFDPAEFLSPYGLRALSAYHREHPYVLDAGGVRATIDYEPAESTTAMFGGNSNWRGPIWFPLNYLVAAALQRYHRFFGDDYTVEYPTGSGQRLTLDAIARRPVGPAGVDLPARRRRPPAVLRRRRAPAARPAVADNLLFSEYFHGDNGAGLGASHQTGWTGVIADIIRRRHGEVSSIGDLLRELRDTEADQ